MWSSGYSWWTICEVKLQDHSSWMGDPLVSGCQGHGSDFFTFSLHLIYFWCFSRCWFHHWNTKLGNRSSMFLNYPRTVRSLTFQEQYIFNYSRIVRSGITVPLGTVSLGAIGFMGIRNKSGRPLANPNVCSTDAWSWFISPLARQLL